MSSMPKTRQWFGRGGTQFIDAFATTPTCCPSRASIFTGQYAHNHAVHTSEAGQAEKLDQSSTLQSQLSAAGYETAIAGKYLNEWDPAIPPPHFDRYAMWSDRAAKGYRGGYWNIDGHLRRMWRYSTRIVEDHALGFLEDAEQQDSRPWLLFVMPWAPHHPVRVEQGYADSPVPRFPRTPATWEEDISDKAPSVAASQADRPKVRLRRKNQLRALMSVDDLVDSVMKRLEALGEGSSTLSFFMSDNGYLLGDHGLIGKLEPYRGSVMIPLFTRWPGRIEPGVTDDRLVANIDIAPTVYDAVGVEPAHVVDGRSLLDRGHSRDRILLEHWQRGARETTDWAGLWSHGYSYIERYSLERLVPDFREFYDLAADEWQLQNLLADTDPSNDPDVAELSLQLRQDMVCSGTTGPSACP